MGRGNVGRRLHGWKGVNDFQWPRFLSNVSCWVPPSAPGLAHMLCVLPRQDVSCGSPNLGLDLLRLRTVLSDSTKLLNHIFSPRHLLYVCACIFVCVSVCVCMYLCVYVCVYVCLCMYVYMFRCVCGLYVCSQACVFSMMEDRLQESVLSFHCVGPWD